MGGRKSLRSIGEYSRKLPKGVFLRRSTEGPTFILTHGKKELGRRCEEVVLQWKEPDKVFGYLADVWLSGRRFPDEVTK